MNHLGAFPEQGDIVTFTSANESILPSPTLLKTHYQIAKILSVSGVKSRSLRTMSNVCENERVVLCCVLSRNGSDLRALYIMKGTKVHLNRNEENRRAAIAASAY